MLGQRADSAHAAPVFRYPVRAPERRLPVASHVRQETDAKEPASPPEVSDEALMAAYCAGDEGAFRRLFQRYGGRIYSFLLHTTGERTQAEDLSQQTWLKLHRARGSFDGGSRFAAWLYTIAANLRRDEARVRRRRPEDLTIDGQVPPFAASFEPQVSAEAEAVRRALLSLPEDQRSIIVLHRYHDLGMAEIAALHGISESAAKVRAFRGYERLRELLRAEVPA